LLCEFLIEIFGFAEATSSTFICEPMNELWISSSSFPAAVKVIFGVLNLDQLPFISLDLHTKRFFDEWELPQQVGLAFGSILNWFLCAEITFGVSIVWCCLVREF
jgi:hypothetical protein